MAKFMRTEKGTKQTSSEPKEDITTAEPAPLKQQDPARRPDQSAEPSIISASLKVTGNLESDAEIRLDGRVEGDVRGKDVTIGEGANITGSVYGETVNVAGMIEGKIEARTVVVGKTAHITGEIIHKSLQIEAGAYIDGHCRPEFGKNDTESESPKPTGPAKQPEIKAAEKPTGATGGTGTAGI